MGKTNSAKKIHANHPKLGCLNVWMMWRSGFIQFCKIIKKRASESWNIEFHIPDLQNHCIHRRCFPQQHRWRPANISRQCCTVCNLPGICVSNIGQETSQSWWLAWLCSTPSTSSTASTSSVCPPFNRSKYSNLCFAWNQMRFEDPKKSANKQLGHAR